MTRRQLDRIYTGDALEVLRRWPAERVDLVLTSPPYFQLRDYGAAGQLGREETPAAYVRNLVLVMGEIRRVLKQTGSLYLNLGDSYQAKRLLGIPWRVALALADEGWLLRNAIVWHKPNPVPTPARDRLTASYELLFHLVKSRHYSFDLDAVRIPHKRIYRSPSRLGPPRRPARLPHQAGRPVPGNFRPHPKGKNPGDVWSIVTETRPKRFIVPGTSAHFAPFPEALCERPIQAASPPCGIVLDPFIGSGTTAVVARRLGRHYLGIELSPSYAALARRRLRAQAPSLAPHRSCRLFRSSSRRGTANSRLCRKKQQNQQLSFSVGKRRTL